jgi:hypothetical protein
MHKSFFLKMYRKYLITQFSLDSVNSQLSLFSKADQCKLHVFDLLLLRIHSSSLLNKYWLYNVHFYCVKGRLRYDTYIDKYLQYLISSNINFHLVLSYMQLFTFCLKKCLWPDYFPELYDNYYYRTWTSKYSTTMKS